MKPEDTLTPRELQAAMLVGEGCANREIAARMGNTVNTVKLHVSRAMCKTGSESRLQLGLWFRDKFPDQASRDLAFERAFLGVASGRYGGSMDGLTRFR